MSIINRETDYAIRIIRELSDKNCHSVSQICLAQEIKQPFAYKIIKKLEKIEIVGIVRGKQGGVKLIKELDRISLYEIMGALDNVQYINDCFKPGFACEFSKSGHCGIHKNLAKLQHTIDTELKACTLNKII